MQQPFHPPTYTWKSMLSYGLLGAGLSALLTATRLPEMWQWVLCLLLVILAAWIVGTIKYFWHRRND